MARKKLEPAAIPERIAILGWGSLVWEAGGSFDEWREEKWKLDGPKLRLEFSRVSSRRFGALTLIIDKANRAEVQVAWCLSKRLHLEDAKCDLRCREGAMIKDIGVMTLDLSVPLPENQRNDPIESWAYKQKIKSVVWTALQSNFEEKTRMNFSVPHAITHLKSLTPEGKAKASEYIWRAPEFVKTPLRTAIEIGPWF